MRHLIYAFFAVFLVAIFVAPQWAEARAGGGGSMGSRGTRTYQSSPSAQPIQRSTAAPPSSVGATPSQTGSMPGSGHPFLYGLAGGLLGAGLAGMLFGGGAGGGGIGLFPILLIAGLGYYLYRRSRGAGTASYNDSSANIPFVSSTTSYAPQMAAISSPLAITDSDKNAFEQLLQQIQQNWSEGNLARLRQYVTPEMLQYFSEELSANASRGEANKVEQVQLQSADITETWSEYGMDYATARLQWSALDYMVRLDKEPHDADYVASGNNSTPAIAEEMWTFARASGGHWLLSAIQQMA